MRLNAHPIPQVDSSSMLNPILFNSEDNKKFSAMVAIQLSLQKLSENKAALAENKKILEEVLAQFVNHPGLKVHQPIIDLLWKKYFWAEEHGSQLIPFFEENLLPFKLPNFPEDLQKKQAVKVLKKILTKKFEKKLKFLDNPSAYGESQVNTAWATYFWMEKNCPVLLPILEEYLPLTPPNLPGLNLGHAKSIINRILNTKLENIQHTLHFYILPSVETIKSKNGKEIEPSYRKTLLAGRTFEGLETIESCLKHINQIKTLLRGKPFYPEHGDHCIEEAESLLNQFLEFPPAQADFAKISQQAEQKILFLKAIIDEATMALSGASFKKNTSLKNIQQLHFYLGKLFLFVQTGKNGERLENSQDRQQVTSLMMGFLLMPVEKIHYKMEMMSRRLALLETHILLEPARYKLKA